MAFQKRFGQHFLCDQNILGKITEAMELTGEEVVVEVGPGIGTLTERLLSEAKEYYAIEIDRKFCEILEEAFGSEEHFHLIESDVLKADLRQIPKGAKVIGNLPYYITSAILMFFLEGDYEWSSLTFMMQKEVAERISAPVGSKTYGVLSVITQSLSTPEILFNIPAGAFYPPPKVESALMRFHPKEVALPDGLIPLIKASFSSRRKTLTNNLKSLYDKEVLGSAFADSGILPEQRAQSLSAEDFVRLHAALSKAQKEA